MHSQGPEQMGQYGAAAYDQQYGYGGPAKSAFMRTQRRSFNLPAILTAFFTPMLLFIVLSATVTFQLHYDSMYGSSSADLYHLIIYGCIAFVAYTGFVAFRSITYRVEGREPTWFVFLFATCFIAAVWAFQTGSNNFSWNMRPYYETINLNVYPMVDPQTTVGQQLMDMGQVQFVPSTRLDLRMSMGFKDDKVYCVAPIVSGNGSMNMRYDFWAVGLNCCSGHASDFACGEFNNPMAHAGLRLVHPELRPYFRLAVQQAEAAYNIKTVHSVFMYFVQDPLGELNAYADAGTKKFVEGVLTFIAVQVLLVVLATVAFSKMA